MPELPEVETTRRGIAPYVEGQKVTAVRLYDRRLRWPVPEDLPQRLVGRVVEKVERRSKYLLFRLGMDTLLIHLGMTGSLRVYKDAPPKRIHDHVDLEFGNGVILRYHDPRRFGAVLWLQDAAHHPLLTGLGPEPLRPEFDADHLFRATRKRRAAIKLAQQGKTDFLGTGGGRADQRRGRVVHAADRIEILLDAVVRERLHDHPCTVIPHRAPDVDRGANRITHVVQAVKY